MKKLNVCLTTVLSLTLFACGDKQDSKSDPNYAKIAEVQKQVDNAILAVPSELSLFTYYKPSKNVYDLYYEDENYLGALKAVKAHKDLNGFFDNFAELLAKESKGVSDNFIKKGDLPKIIDSYSDVINSLGFVFYVGNISFQVPEQTSFAGVIYVDNAQKCIEKFYTSMKESFAKDNKDWADATKTVDLGEGLKGILIDFSSALNNTDNGQKVIKKLVIFADNKRIFIAPTKEDVAVFAANIGVKSESSILNNTEYKKLISKVENPIFGIFSDFRGYKLDPQTAMGLAMFDGMFGIKKNDSIGWFFEDMKEKDFFSMPLILSSQSGSCLYDLFEGAIASGSVLKDSPKGSLFSLSYALPMGGAKIWTSIKNGAMMSGKVDPKALKNISAIEGNFKQVNFTMLDQGSESLVNKVSAALYFNDLDKFISDVIEADKLKIEELSGFKVYSENPPVGQDSLNKFIRFENNAVMYSDPSVPLEETIDFIKGKTASMKNDTIFNELRKRLGYQNEYALEYYFDYALYMETSMNKTASFYQELTKDCLGENFVKDYIDATSKAMKDYKVLIAAKSKGDALMIPLKMHYKIDLKPYVELLDKIDWKKANEKMQEAFEKAKNN